LGAFVGQLADDTSSTLQQIDSQLSGAVGGVVEGEEDTKFPRPDSGALVKAAGGGVGSGGAPLIVDGEIVDIGSPSGLTVESRVSSVRNALMRYDATFMEPLSPEYDLVKQADINAFLESFDLESKTSDVEALIQSEGGVKDAFEEVRWKRPA